ncbi:MAG: hypothetical protein AAFO06_22190, partial [Cyanobacteria bacterium J06597_16]
MYVKGMNTLITLAREGQVLPEMSMAKLKRKGPLAVALAELFGMIYGNTCPSRANVINVSMPFTYILLGIKTITPKKRS